MNPKLLGAAFAVALAAVLAPAWAKAPPGRYQVGAGAAISTVYDTATKLTWQRDGQVAGSKLWADAGKYCAALQLNGGGWRLPTVVELTSLVDRGESNPSIDKVAFPQTSLQTYWASTVQHAAATKAWVVSFGDGANNPAEQQGSSQVRCVR